MQEDISPVSVLPVHLENIQRNNSSKKMKTVASVILCFVGIIVMAFVVSTLVTLTYMALPKPERYVAKVIKTFQAREPVINLDDFTDDSEDPEYEFLRPLPMD